VGRNAQRLAEAIDAIGGNCTAMVGDLSSLAGIDALASELAGQTARLDVLVNNAGTSWVAPFDGVSERGFDKVIDLNLKAPYFLTQRLLPLLSSRGDVDEWARVINLSSIAARVVNPGNSAYGASKAALEHLTRILARALAEHRVTVNGIAPGWFPTQMNAPIAESAGPDWLAATPVGRFGSVEDAGGVALFLASRAGAFVNGQTITLDGGKTL
jgi:NAD(P)-dependent dehydrogenase (short-subunit alcohol dehydrogenase family)